MLRSNMSLFHCINSSISTLRVGSIQALGRTEGLPDRTFVDVDDYPDITGTLEYPCTTGLSEQAVASAAKALRTNPSLVPLLRARIADIETLNVLTSDSRTLLEGLPTIAKDKP